MPVKASENSSSLPMTPYELSALEPAAGESETIDTVLNLDMPEKWSMSLNTRRTHLDSDLEYRESISIGGDVPGSRFVVGIGLNYKF